MSHSEFPVRLQKAKAFFLKFIRPVIYWCLPPVILYLIFRRIDLGNLQQLVASADLRPILLGIVLNMLVVAIAALRWHALFRRYDCASQSIVTSISEYSKGLAVGVLVPGSLGSDAYRVMLLGRQKGYYLRNAFVVGIEKLGAVFACAGLIAGLYPLLAPNHLPAVVARIVDALYLLFLIGIASAVLVALIRRHDWVTRLASAFNAHLETLARRVVSRASTPPAEEDRSTTGLALLLSMFSPGVALPVVALSLAIYLVSAFQAQLYFQGMGYDIPFSVNLFVSPLLFLLFILPISFGGIGIREGAFILLYGAFGVPVEIALVVSFCALLGVLFNYAIGTSLFLLSKR